MAASLKNLASPPATDAKERPRLEFLIISDNKALFQIVAAAIAGVRGRINCAPTAATACDFIAWRRVDGIVVDMGLPGALELVGHVRASGANRSSVVFACLAEPETQPAVQAGANFVLRPPLAKEKVAHVFATAVPMMMAEKRQSFRYPLMVPVELKIKEREVESTMSNLSDGGMAIWSLFYHAPGTSIQFVFELPFGGLVRGQGNVAWSNGDGLAGIRFQALPDEASGHLSAWLQRRDFAGTS